MKFSELKTVLDLNKPNIIWERINDDTEFCYSVLEINIGKKCDYSKYDDREVELVKGNKELNSIVTNIILTKNGENRYYSEKEKENHIIGDLMSLCRCE